MDLRIFIAVAAAAVVTQLGILVATFLALRKTAKTVQLLAEDLRIEISPILHIVRSLAREFGPKLETLTTDVSKVKSLVRSRADHFEAGRNGLEGRVNVQISRGAGLLWKNRQRLEDINETMRRTLIIPTRKIFTLFRVLKFVSRVLTN
jgi:uncharacterized protein YoxC